MTVNPNPPRGAALGIDPTHSPAMMALIVRIAANRLALRQSKEALERVNRDLAALVALPEVAACPQAKAAGQMLTAAPESHEPFAKFTDALVALAKQHPLGTPARSRVFALIAHATRLVAADHEARRKTVAILTRVTTLAREIEAQHALERQQGGGIH
ncbi:hypothetical protein [Halomonas sp. LBP4]|uniref:hypothetical protein n=1 Tax=Halomonas sp. LBP4 TaxID=2044917 RepID=UPI000D7632B1|nr:hypothetical protein [Halomonas sp. LBP4]PXX94995.1 hypothetical protein CR157_20485 [Halomonas sp. LBP4]